MLFQVLIMSHLQVFEGANMSLALIGNLSVSQNNKQTTAFDNKQYLTTFKPFHHNRLQSSIRLKDLKSEPSGQLLIVPSPPRVVRAKDGRCVNPICALNLALPSSFEPMPEKAQEELFEVFKKSMGLSAFLSRHLIISPKCVSIHDKYFEIW